MLVKINVTVVFENIKFAGTPLQIDIKINLPYAQMEISVEKSLIVPIQIKGTEECFPMVMFIILLQS